MVRHQSAKLFNAGSNPVAASMENKYSGKCCYCGNHVKELFKIHSDGRSSCSVEHAKILDRQAHGSMENPWTCNAGHGA